jgi:Nif-specific regulatory protein
MTSPSLVIISGSARGTAFALTDAAQEEISLGRDPSNGFCIPDKSVSRSHCLVRKEKTPIEESADSSPSHEAVESTSGLERFLLRDLESFNGTFVNGKPITETVLEHGDQITVGDVTILFLMHQDDAMPTESQVQIDDGEMTTLSSILLKRSDAVFLSGEKLVARLSQDTRLARDLNVLLSVSSSINTIRSLDDLKGKLLNAVFEAIPAETAAILINGGDAGEFTSVTGRARESTNVALVRISRTVANQVLREGVSILSNDVVQSSRFEAIESLVAENISALMCVPLSIFEKVFGVIFVSATDAQTSFDEQHLQLLTAIAAFGAVAIRNVEKVILLEEENELLHRQIDLEHNMVGDCARMTSVYQTIAKIAQTDSTVLILGESGTGKELAARAIHENSSRKAKPFVAINCAALTESLLESELFGHERGAFTGAIALKKGKLEIADGGTLFRDDLYYRLNVISFVMPPLRERREDIPLLANYFASKYSQRCNRRVTGVSADARACLTSYDWPGNVRELENAIERAIVLGSSDQLMPEDLPESVIESAVSSGSVENGYYESLKEAKKVLIQQAIERADGNYTLAAKILGVHPNNLHRLIRNLNMKSTASG